DLAVGERRVVVGNLAQARRGAGCFCFGADPVDRQRGVLGGTAQFAAAVGTARHRTAAQQNVWTVRSAASWRGGYSRLPARASTRDKRGCHLGRGQSRGPRGRPPF